MFEFFKNKLKQVVSVFSKKIEAEAKPVEVEAPKQEEKREDPRLFPKEEPKIEHRKEQPKVEEKREPQKPKIETVPRKEEPKEEPKPTPRPVQKEPSKPEIHVHKEEHKPEPQKIQEEPKSKREEPKLVPKEEPHPKTESPKEKIPEIKPEIAEPPKPEKRGFFDFLKKKEPEPKPEPQKAHEEPKPVREEPQKEPFRSEVHIHKEPKPEPTLVEPEQKPVPRPSPKGVPREEPKRNIFDIVKEKITKQLINESQFEEMFGDLEMALLENSVALEVIDKIKLDLKSELVNKPLERGKIEAIIESSLKKTIEGLFDIERIDLLKRIKEKKPFIICFVGINGSGKTTTIAKLAHLLKKQGISSVMAAGDTFRAAAIQQLEEHANRLSIRLIKHDYGADSAAVAFDAITHAKAHNIDVVLIDTAGRLHSNANLMDEVKKVKRVTKPDLIIFVGESITGNDCVEQAKTFDQELGIDGIILAKSDVDDKGGAAISISYVTKKPIMYLGTGQGYDDLVEFDSRLILKSLGLES
jgi:fused signal recognition particle receptor